MAVNNPHSIDRAYKFIYKVFGALFHYYLYHESGEIEFIDTEIPETGQRKDISVIVNGESVRITEFMSKKIDDKKGVAIYEYHSSTRIDFKKKKLKVKTTVVSTAKANSETTIAIEIDDNIIFKIDVIYLKSISGWKVLNSFVNKVINQEEISVKDAIDLLLLPDMDIEMPIKELMSMIIVLIGKANFPDFDLKEKTIKCECIVLNRFFRDDELDEMINMLKSEVKDPKVAKIIEKYGPGLDVYYLGGKQDGYNEGYNEGIDEGIIKTAKNLLKNGFGEEIVATNTELPLSKIKQLKREL